MLMAESHAREHYESAARGNERIGCVLTAGPTAITSSVRNELAWHHSTPDWRTSLAATA